MTVTLDCILHYILYIFAVKLKAHDLLSRNRYQSPVSENLYRFPAGAIRYRFFLVPKSGTS